MSDTNAAPVSQSYGGNVSESEDIRIPPQGLIGSLRIPKNAYALVVFVHGSGSSRLSPRNVLVARALNDRGIATLLLSILTSAEDSLPRQRVRYSPAGGPAGRCAPLA